MLPPLIWPGAVPLTATSGGNRIGSSFVSYDGLGNITHTSFNTLSFNRANQVTDATTTTGNSNSYLYDGHNRRVKKTGPAGTEYSLYSYDGTLMYRETEEGGINYIYLGRKLIAQDGHIPEDSPKQHYRPYGQSIEGETDDVGYTGHKFDIDLGLSYMQARYYDPVIGRFYSNDPVGTLGHLYGANGIQGFNRFNYAINNPYKFVDPDGREVKVAHVSPGLGLGMAGHTFLGSGSTAYTTAMNMDGVGVGNFNDAIQSYIDDGREVTVFTLEDSSSTEMERAVNKAILNHDAGTYFPIFNNCSDMVIDVLNQAGAMEGNTSVLGQITPDGTANSPTSVNGYLSQEYQDREGSGLVKGITRHRVSGRTESIKLRKPREKEDDE